MRAGKRRALAMGMAAFIVFAGPAHAEEAGGGMASLRKNAVVKIGGEMTVDFRYGRSTASTSGAERKSKKTGATDFQIGTARLRLSVDAHPSVRALFKVNLNPDPASSHDREILEEAIMIMKSVGGTGIDFFVGMGRAPYGQDVTLGMIQSYHHAANRGNSPEGDVFIIDPPGDPDASGEAEALPAMRPGQLDRSVMAGAAYQWDERWRFEAAAFRPDYSNYRPRLRERAREDRGGLDSDVGASARLWFMPVEDLVVEASGIWLRSAAMGDARLRTDPAAAARKDAFAASLGFDWRRDPWMVFGEYEHGWDWNFTKGYETDAWQLGAAREFGRWRLGAMGETMRIHGGPGGETVDDYHKAAVNIRREFSPGLFVLAEYGHEWFKRKNSGGVTEKRRSGFFGIRLGFSF